MATFNIYINKKNKSYMDQLLVYCQMNELKFSDEICKAVKERLEHINSVGE